MEGSGGTRIPETSRKLKPCNGRGTELEGMTRLLVCPPEYYRIAYVINSWMRLEVAEALLYSRHQWNNLKGVLQKEATGALVQNAAAPCVPGIVVLAHVRLSDGLGQVTT